MKIASYLPQTQASFCAKNRDVRKADDIMRDARQEFPMFAPNFAYDYYTCTKPESKYYNKALYNVHLQSKKLGDCVRYEVTDLNDKLDKIKKYKVGQCYEQTLATMAKMYSEGYEKLTPVGLFLQIDLKNKNTGKVEDKGAISLDHSLIITTMDNQERKTVQDIIVIDPWLGFADTMSGSYSKYQAAFDKNIKEIEFEIYAKLSNRNINPGDYIIKKSFVFNKIIFPEDELEKVKNYLKT